MTVKQLMGACLIDHIVETFRFYEMESAVRAEFYANDGHSIMRRASDMITEQLWDDVEGDE